VSGPASTCRLPRTSAPPQRLEGPNPSCPAESRARSWNVWNRDAEGAMRRRSVCPGCCCRRSQVVGVRGGKLIRIMFASRFDRIIDCSHVVLVYARGPCMSATRRSTNSGWTSSAHRDDA
jgi:hypothetical protein